MFDWVLNTPLVFIYEAENYSWNNINDLNDVGKLIKIIQGYKISIVSMMWKKNIENENEIVNKTNQNLSLKWLKTEDSHWSYHKFSSLYLKTLSP